MDMTGFQHSKLKWNLDLMQIILRGRLEVHSMFDRLGETDTDVKSVHDGLPEILLQGCFTQTTEINSVKMMLFPAKRVVLYLASC